MQSWKLVLFLSQISVAQKMFLNGEFELEKYNLNINISNRYALSEIEMEIENPANFSQNFIFAVDLNEQEFITRFHFFLNTFRITLHMPFLKLKNCICAWDVGLLIVQFCSYNKQCYKREPCH